MHHNRSILHVKRNVKFFDEECRDLVKEGNERKYRRLCGMKEMFNKWLAPIWQGERMWEESLCFYEDGIGEIRGGKLLYEPEDLRLTNHDATIEYELHKDYELEGRCVKLLPGSRIPVLARAIYCKPYEGVEWTDWLRLPDGKALIMICPEVYRYQILATYSHKEEEWNTKVTGKVLPGLKKKLESREPVHLVFFGDSITAGCEASGADEATVDMGTLGNLQIRGNHYPHMPVWAQLIRDRIQQLYPGSRITKDNLASCGSHTEWAVAHMEELFGRVDAPDVVFIGFGMNCMWESAEIFGGRIRQIMDHVRTLNPHCEFVLYPAMVANGEMNAYQHHNMKEFEEVLLQMAEEDAAVTAAPLYSMFCELLEKGKEYYEISGNCVNHPNDFSIRLYGQLILASMGLDMRE